MHNVCTPYLGPLNCMEVQIMGNHIRTMLSENPELSNLYEKLKAIVDGSCSHATQCFTPSPNCGECRKLAKVYLNSINLLNQEFSPGIHTCRFIKRQDLQILIDAGVPLKNDFYHSYIKVYYTCYRDCDFGVYYVLLTPLNDLFSHRN